MKKITHSRRNSYGTRRTMELAALEPRMLLCALHDGGLDDLPSNLGTFPAVHSDLDHDHADLDIDYPGAAGTTSGTATVSGATVPVSASAVPALHSNSSATAKLYLDFSGSSDATWGTGYAPGTTPAYSQ